VNATADIFQAIYATDLVYQSGCWQLCGDAHCCSFSRYKSQMTMLGHQTRQELPLFPGEYEFLERTGRLAGFGDAQRRVLHFPLSAGTMNVDFLAAREGACACPHDVRTTVCRLYPLFPIFDLEGRITGVDPNFGSFEEIESIDGSDRACKLTSIPFAELDKLLAITGALGSDPTIVFYAMAYRIAKRHAAESLRRAKAARPASAPRLPTLRLFESMFLLRQLFDPAAIRGELDALADTFRDRYGDRFSL
jgi:hypothetical protein